MSTTEINIEKLKAEIDRMSRFEMARAWRFSHVGDPFFIGEIGDYFTERFKKLGGFSPEISKKIGWGKY
jgi:hypothetical protein